LQNLSSVPYTYDAISRLTGSTQNETYGYDAVGNRLTGPKTTDTMTYNTGNEQMSLNRIAYEYDLNGNRIRRTRNNGEVTTYAYDDENRLIRVTQGSTTITYAYDPFGRRIEKNANGVITQYVYDNEDILMEYDGLGNLKARYTHGPGIDEPLAVQQGNNTYYYHANGLGSIVVITNSVGLRVKTYAYDSFGNMTQTGNINQPYTYTAREHDPETGLYYYRARYYDPRAGRFITRDPILHPSNGNGNGCRGSNLAYQNGVPSFEEMQKNPQNLNPYAYAGNNPINFSDPLGLACGSGKWEPYIPDNYGAWSFTGPCQNHDNCYDTCGNSKAGCDIKFYFDMLGVCARIGGALSSTGASCVSAASIYYAAVAGTSAAQKAYEDAQNTACNGCKK
jgi:RHS repeat-associated protein